MIDDFICIKEIINRKFDKSKIKMLIFSHYKIIEIRLSFKD